MQHMDGLSQTLCNHKAIDRHTYKVPQSNYLWHVDGYHKMIYWGIVIHGFPEKVVPISRGSKKHRVYLFK